jgi:ABC-type uncharacterized transport system substrate-binding protein
MAIHIRRREFIGTLGGAAAAWPLAARTQQPAMPVIGFLNARSLDEYRPMVDAFHQGLQETGYVDGQNATIEYRWAEGHYDRLPALAADLVQQRVTVIAATTTPAALAAKAATSTVPIVFATGGDPIKLGLIASLRRPGGNVTGSTQLSVEVGPKRLELARELFPGATTVALLVNPANALAATVSKDLQAVADTLGVRLHVLHASTETDFEAAFATAAQIASSARDRQRRSAVRRPRRAARRTRPPLQGSSNLFSARVAIISCSANAPTQKNCMMKSSIRYFGRGRSITAQQDSTSTLRHAAYLRGHRLKNYKPQCR